MRALWLVNELWVIVPVNPRKNRTSSDLLYKSNRPQVSMGYKLIYYIHSEIIGYPCNVIGSQRCDLFPNRTIFCSKVHLLSRPMRMAQKNKTTNQISRLFLNLPITLQENERQKSLFNKFGNFCCENFIKLKMDEFNYQYSTKIL